MNGCDRIDQMLSYYNIFNRKTVKWWKRIFVCSLEVAQVNSYMLFCLTRDDGEKPVNLLKYKNLLVNQLLAEADTIKTLDHKQHKIARPNNAVNSNQPSHLVKWVKNDRNCVVCSGPEEQIICVTLVMFIYMQKSALVHFILPEVLILNRLHTSLLQKLRLFKNVKV